MINNINIKSCSNTTKYNMICFYGKIAKYFVEYLDSNSYIIVWNTMKYLPLK